MLTLDKLAVYKQLMSHPNFLDRIKKLLDSQYLFPGQLCIVTEPISVSIVRKILSRQSFWTISDTQKLSKGDQVRFLGKVKNFQYETNLPPKNLFFELAASCDTIMVTPQDLKHISGKS